VGDWLGNTVVLVIGTDVVMSESVDTGTVVVSMDASSIFAVSGILIVVRLRIESKLRWRSMIDD